MALILENQHLQLVIHPDLARWSLTSRMRNGPILEYAQMSASYRRGRLASLALDRWPAYQVSPIQMVPSLHGLTKQVSLSIGRPRDQLHYQLTFVLPEEQPFLLWRIAIENRGTAPVNIDRVEMLSAGFIYRTRSDPRGAVRLFSNSKEGGARGTKGGNGIYSTELAFFSNGWQSWSYTGTYKANDFYNSPRHSPFRSPVVSNPGTPQPRRAGLFASDMFGILGDCAHRTAILAGFLSQKQNFGSLEAWIGPPGSALRLWANGDGVRLDPGKILSTDWACLYIFQLDSPDPLEPYLQGVARENALFPEDEDTSNALPADRTSIPTGWCSWYQFFKDLRAEDILQNLSAAADLRPDLPLELIQVDDGYTAHWGDWLSSRDVFPEGVGTLAGQIRQSGFTPGLWLAPFIVATKSRLMANHPDWVLRNRLRRPVNAGFFNGAFATALDLTHPAAREYVSSMIERAVHQWGYSYLKLDFLYAGALPGRRSDPTRTRAQVLRDALQSIRQVAGTDTTLLGCGCPLGSAIGLVDAMRIGPDVAVRWQAASRRQGRTNRRGEGRPSTRAAIHNALTRAPFHRRWWINDPDCLLLRPTTELSLAEVQSLATVIALSGGSLLLSDHLPDLPPDRRRIAQVLFPLIGKRPYVLDWFGTPTPHRLQVDLDGPTGHWHVLALFNWADAPEDVHLLLQDFYLDPRIAYHGREFWTGSSYKIDPGKNHDEELVIPQIPPHGVALLALRPLRPYQPQYLGSDLHISQGMEVIHWEADARQVRLRLGRPGHARGQLLLSLPQPPGEALIDGHPIGWSAHQDSDYKNSDYIFEVDFMKEAELLVNI
jgi:alpha-galactosidase